MGYILKIFVLALCSGQVFPGLLNILDPSTDYNVFQLLDILYGIGKNDTKYLFLGGSQNQSAGDVIFWVANRKAPNLTEVQESDLTSKIDMSKPIVFIIHGWIDTGSRNWILDMVNDYLQFADVNVCVVDWGKLAIHGYTIAVKNTYKVADYIASFITRLTDQGVSLDEVTLVGHSLGAQIAGHTGRKLEGKIGAIYGLDPASPLFLIPLDVGTDKRLDKSDARYVQMIITSRCALGVCNGDAHDNFYPSGGTAPQPNCYVPLFDNALSHEPISCSHSHSFTLFRMALNPNNVFVGPECSSYTLFLAGWCSKTKSNRMGIYSTRTGGDFYVKTSIFPPHT
ncbi:lipase member H-A-like [Toxorhynchites rutilus septentrionalis]|uniref:lipase member H-A-like n=1 Tax=Toxorhynchites rutilus septentrionalis TaxID=329112 RepID=UPI0024792275|nr:lipase member H-A-like [Toxorhynchites rutilus septentrionalis]